MKVRRLLSLGVLLLWACSRPSSRDLPLDIKTRPTEGRLTRELRYAPFQAKDGLKGAGGPPGVRRGSGGPGGGTGNPERLADQAALALRGGEVEGAVRRLEQAAALAPEDPRWWSDLAAAHLAAPGDPQHLFSALEAAERALSLASDLPEALFNRAVALQLLFLWPEARSAWEEYLRVDRGSPWAEEAETRKAEMAKSSEEERWRFETGALREAALRGDGEAVAGIVARHPQNARLLAEEELLGQWARAVRDGRPADADEALTIARSLGEALARFNDDRLLLRSVEVIEEGQDGPKRADLLAGHLAYQEGVEGMRERSDLEGVRVPLEEARTRLTRAGSPLAHWALFQLGFRHFLVGEPEQALEKLGEVCRIAEGEPYKSLGGRAWWLSGSSLLFQARYSEALAAFRRALSLFERTREANHLAGVHTLLARTLDSLGDSRAAWRHRHEALRRAAEGGSVDRVRVAYAEAAWTLLDEDRPALAAAFQEEAVRAAVELANPGHLATALRQRAAIRHRLEDVEGALEDLRAAQVQAQKIPDPASLETTRYELAVTEAQVRMESDPAGALRAVEAALVLGKDRYFVPSLLVERSRAHLALGDPQAAESDLETAIEEIEAQRDGIDEALRRASYLDQARKAYEDVVWLQIANGRGSETALDSAERARARVLFEWISGLPSGLPARDAALRAPAALRPVSSLRRTLPAGLVAVEYMVQEDRTLAWVVRAEGVEFVSLPAGARDLASRAAAWRRVLDGRKPREEEKLASSLHDVLVRPLERFLRPEDAIVFLPDRVLHGVPFSALRNAATGHRLFRDRVTSVAPSLNVLAACRKRARRSPPSSTPSVLVVAEPRFDRSVFDSLPSLPWASREAGETVALYPGALLLSGAEATEARLLAEAGRHDILHFIGHAQLSRENPLLSSLILAPDPGVPRSGVLYAHELLGRRLERTKLVVLSACNTGVGPDSPTEGALSVAAPFLAAGVPAVVASLWDVDDRASARLMIAFHRHLRQGVSPAEALRSARLEMIDSRDPALVHPRSWAAFELIGGW